MAQVGRLALSGTAAGLLLALAIGYQAQSLLFGLTAFDPLVLAVAAMLIALVTFAAGFPPARRVSRVAPIEALRYE
jgi:ABC-type antimicrobial peptide transport system permease subunit